MQNQITEKQKLLNEKGRLANPGFAFHPLFEYSRNEIAASVWRIKEWDYYATLNNDYGFSCTIADLGYSYLVGAVFLDFNQKSYQKKTKIGWFSFGKLNMPSTSEKGDVHYTKDGYDFHFIRKDNERLIECRIDAFDGNKPLYAKLEIRDMKDETMVIATPWNENLKAFYYNQKINCMPTNGRVSIGDKTVHFQEDTAFTVLDWGRGVWTYKNTWYWGSASGVVDGKRFGFNIGYGFGNTAKATENMLFYDGKAHKLDQVEFHIDPTDYMKPWVFTSPDHRFELTMEPLIDRQDTTNFLIIKNLGHQVFGRFKGYVVLDDGTKLIIDQLTGFAEQITNHY